MPLLARAAIRRLGQRPIASATVAGTLALAIGANTAIFSAIDAILLRPLPYPSPDRLVSVYESNPTKHQATTLVAPVRLEEWQHLNRSFEGLAGCFFENMADTTARLPERVAAMRVSPGFFAVLGAAPEAGRWPAADEQRLGGRPVIVLSDRFWRARFQADPSAIGRSLRLGGVDRTIVGIMPSTFSYPDSKTDVWMPAQLPPALTTHAREARIYKAVGRVKAGVTIAEAQADLAAVQASLGRTFPATDSAWSATIKPLAEERVAGFRQSLWLLFGAVALVLLAACGNVACVMLAEASLREGEIAMRYALGAKRRALIGQLLAEGLALAAAGSVGGLLLAYWGMAAVRELAATLPRANEIQIDGRIMAFTLLLGAGTTLLFAWVPALHATRPEMIDRVARPARTQVRGAQLLQRTLVACQVALAVVLLVGSGLFLKTFFHIHQVRLGFDPENVLTFRISAQWAEAPAAVMNRQRRTIDRLERLPGVESAAFSSLIPAGLDLPPGEFAIVGRESTAPLFAAGRQVSGRYFRTLSIPVLRGETCRDDPADLPFSRVLVTRTFAERFFPGEDPLGRSIVRAMPAAVEARIVGVVGDVREDGLTKDPPALIYSCGLNPYWPDPYYLIRISPGRPVSISTVRNALTEIDPGRALFDVASLDERLADTIATTRLNAIGLGLFAVMGVLLAAIGLYGVLSQFVTDRRREIALRLALGASIAHIAARVARQMALPTVWGLVLGLASAFATVRLIAAVLVGVSPYDLMTFVAAAATLTFVAGLAAVMPTRRALHTAPAEALKEQ